MRRGRGPQGRPPQAALGRPKAAHEGLCPSALRAPAGMLQKPDKEMPRNFSTTEELRDIIEILFQEGASGNVGKFLPGGICGGAPYPGRESGYLRTDCDAGGQPPGFPHCGRGTAPQPRTRQNALPPGGIPGWQPGAGLCLWRDGSAAGTAGSRGGHLPAGRAGGWIWPGTSGPAKMKRCNIG